MYIWLGNIKLENIARTLAHLKNVVVKPIYVTFRLILFEWKNVNPLRGEVF